MEIALCFVSPGIGDFFSCAYFFHYRLPMPAFTGPLSNVVHCLSRATVSVAVAYICVDCFILLWNTYFHLHILLLFYNKNESNWIITKHNG